MVTYANRVAMTTATTGTGTVTLGSAIGASFQTFAEGGVTNGATVRYLITEGNDFEIGIGTYTSSGTTLSRTTVERSKIGGTAGSSKMNLAGSAQVRIIASAADYTAFDIPFTKASSSGAASLVFAEDTDNGAHAITVQAPASVAANATVTLPGVTATLATLAGTETLSGKTLTDPVITGTITEDVYTITDGAGFVINPRNGSMQQVTLGANRTPTVSGWVSGDAITLKVADGSAYTITWTTIGVVWVGGSAPTLATSGFTLIVLWRDGSTYYGKYVGDVAS